MTKNLPFTNLGLTPEETIILAFNAAMIDALGEAAVKGEISLEASFNLVSTIPSNALRLYMGETLNEGRPDALELAEGNELYLDTVRALTTWAETLSAAIDQRLNEETQDVATQ